MAGKHESGFESIPSAFFRNFRVFVVNFLSKQEANENSL